MKADFETFAAVISFLLDGAGVATLAALLDNKQLKDLQSDLGEAVQHRLSDFGYVRRKNQALVRELFSVPVILLHILNLLIFAGILYVLISGPQNLPVGLMSGTAAEPLTLLEKILYAIFWILIFLGYLIKCVIPTLQYGALYRKARRWLKENDPHKPAS